eukprot:365679-Chlamydomonas_euryale.AAC.8
MLRNEAVKRWRRLASRAGQRICAQLVRVERRHNVQRLWEAHRRGACSTQKHLHCCQPVAVRVSQRRRKGLECRGQGRRDASCSAALTARRRRSGAAAVAPHRHAAALLQRQRRRFCGRGAVPRDAQHLWSTRVRPGGRCGRRARRAVRRCGAAQATHGRARRGGTLWRGPR